MRLCFWILTPWVRSYCPISSFSKPCQVPVFMKDETKKAFVVEKQETGPELGEGVGAEMRERERRRARGRKGGKGKREKEEWKKWGGREREGGRDRGWKRGKKGRKRRKEEGRE